MSHGLAGNRSKSELRMAVCTSLFATRTRNGLMCVEALVSWISGGTTAGEATEESIHKRFFSLAEKMCGDQVSCSAQQHVNPVISRATENTSHFKKILPKSLLSVKS